MQSRRISGSSIEGWFNYEETRPLVTRLIDLNIDVVGVVGCWNLSLDTKLHMALKPSVIHDFWYWMLCP